MPFLFKNQMLICSSFLLISSFAQAKQPMWTVEPVAGSSPTQVIQEGASVSISYLVTNYSLKNKKLQMLTIPGVQTNGPCNLAPRGQAGSQCTLSLTINGSQIPKNGIHNGPVLCQVNSNGVPNEQQCYQPSAGNGLQISRSSGSQIKHVTVGGYADIGGVYPLAYYSLDNGQSWTQSQVPNISNGMILGSVSCNSTVMHCVAVAVITEGVPLNPVAIVSDDGGKSWLNSASITPYQSNPTQLTHVACDTEGVTCVAAGGYKINVSDEYTFPVTYTSKDGGKNWGVSASLPSPMGVGGELTDIYCNKTASQCIVVGYYRDLINIPVIYFSNDSGASWSNPALPPVIPQGVFRSVSCAQNELNCLVVGDFETKNSYASNDGGQSWVDSSVPLDWEYYFISCDPNNAPCTLAVGYKDGTVFPSSFVSNNNMLSWAGPYIINSAAEQIPQNISCREKQCIAVGSISDGSFWLRNSQDNGVTWNSPVITPPDSAIASLLFDAF